MDDTTPIVREDYEDIKDSQANGRDGEEIDSYHFSDMIAKKRHPSLCRLPIFRHQSRHCSFGNLKPELQQFSMDARRSPDRIGGSCYAARCLRATTSD